MINFLLKPSLRLVAAITSSVSVLGVLSLSSCQEYEPFTVEEVSLAKQSRTFATNFVNHYGEPDPNHTWGFRSLSGASMALTRANVPNKNQWLTPGTTGYIADKVEVPGWPDKWIDKNGVEHIGWNDGKTSGDYHNEEGYAASPSTLPGGDVTDEEIEYVSWYFRTHQYPEHNQVHFTDFFIQEISSDVDRNPDGTKNDFIPITYYTSNGQVDNAEGKVGQGTYENFGINHLLVKTFNGSSSGEIHKAGYDHIYNFNWGKSNKLGTKNEELFKEYTDLPMDGESPYLGDKYPVRNIGFYTSSGTEDFAAQYSNDALWRMNDETEGQKVTRKHPIWIFHYLEFVGKSGRVYKGWYLCFDYEFYERTDIDDGGYKIQEREQDGYYSNWILKVVPAKAAPNTGRTTRVMCEDLGNTFDYDFNDVVFDATYNGNNDWTISVQAAGGTMPIYVGVEPNTVIMGNDMEIHSLMEGPDSSTPLNVIETGTTYAPAIYHITLASDNAKDIPVYVVSTGNAASNQLIYQVGGPTQKGESKVPQKFAVPTYVQWMQECQFIEMGYDLFPAWVRNDQGSANWFTHINTKYNPKNLIYHYVPVNYDVIPGGNPSDVVAVTERATSWGGKECYIASSAIGAADSGKSYKVTVTVSGNGNFNSGPKMKRGTLSDSGFSTDNTEINAESSSQKAAVFIVSGDKLVDGKYFYFSDTNFSADDVLTVKVTNN